MIQAIDGGLIGLAYILAETVKHQVTKRNGKNGSGLSSAAQIREFDRLGEAIKDQALATRELRDHLGETIREQTVATRELRDVIKEMK